MTSKLLKRTVLLLVIAGAGMQLFRPDRSNPPVDAAQSVQATATVPAAVDAVFRRSCYDCHSSETRWPWYSGVAPVAWAVAGDVHEARAQFSFSEWGTYPVRKRVAILEKMCDEVREGKMPLKQYLWLHRDATLSEADWKAVCDWSAEEADRLAAGR
jgi:acyl-CoA reductase-like NAD-dependent aldehyde dehydrogenase